MRETWRAVASLRRLLWTERNVHWAKKVRTFNYFKQKSISGKRHVNRERQQLAFQMPRPLLRNHMALLSPLKLGPQFTILSIQWQEFPEFLCRNFRRIKKGNKIDFNDICKCKTLYKCVILLIKKALNILHPHYKLSCENKAVLFH